jgi:hypothetical protein
MTTNANPNVLVSSINMRVGRLPVRFIAVKRTSAFEHRVLQALQDALRPTSN